MSKPPLRSGFATGVCSVRGQDSLQRILTIILLFSPTTFAGNACYQSFNEFFAEFENSRAFQMEHMVYPLTYTFVDVGAYPGPKLIKSTLLKQEIEQRKNPIYPYPADQDKVPFVKEISELSSTRKQVKLKKPDTGYVLRYQFEKIEDCWRLTEYNNDSV